MDSNKRVTALLLNIKNNGNFIPNFGSDFKYINSSQMIPLKCIKDGHEVMMRADSIQLKNNGCHRCRGRKKSPDDLRKTIIATNKFIPNFDDTFVHTKNNKIPVICKRGHKLDLRLSSIRHNGCEVCLNINTIKTYDQLIVAIERNKNFKPNFDKDVKIDSRVKIPLLCIANDHPIEMRTDSINLGNGCTTCAGANKTNDDLRKIINAYNVFVPNFDDTFKYKNTATKIPVLCIANNHPLELTYKSFNLQNGCGTCGGWNKTIQDIKDIIIKTGDYTIDFDETLVYKNTDQKFPVICKNGHHIQLPIRGIKKGRCGECHKNAFDPNRPAHFYTVQVGDDIGFGITGYLKSRLTDHKRNVTRAGLNYSFINSWKFENGQDALNLENEVKTKMNIRDTGVAGFMSEAIEDIEYPALVKIISKFNVRNGETVAK